MSNRVKTAGPTLYEGLFLLRQEAATSDFKGCIDFLRTTFERAGAEVKVIRKWDERRLAYDIKGQRRGIFILAYFEVDGVQIANIERDCDLSDHVLRALIIRADHIGETELELEVKEADLAAESAVRQPADEGESVTEAPSADEPPADEGESAETASADEPQQPDEQSEEETARTASDAE